MLNLKNNKKKIQDEFLNNGFVVQPILDINSLSWIKKLLLKNIYFELKKIKKKIPKNFDVLNGFHKLIIPSELNEFRLKVFKNLNSNSEFEKKYYNIAKPYLDILVGDELAIQNNINFSIQCPKDKDSLLPIHADTWDGNSPFELVVWVPMVNCFKTKSMYMLPYQENKKFEKIYKQLQKKRLSVFQALKKKLKWIDINYGEVLIFNLCLPHGNVVNNEKETRWSMNCRFKSLFSPYADKKLGDFFHPLNVKPMTKIGLNYKFIDEKKES